VPRKYSFFHRISRPGNLLFYGYILLFISHLSVHTEDYDPKTPRKLRLEMIYLFDESNPEFILVIGQSGFKTVDSLKKYLEKVPL